MQKALNGKPDSDPQWKQARPDIQASLRQAADNLREGFLYVSLESLSGAIVSFRGMEHATEKGEAQVLKEGLPGVESELRKARLEQAASSQNKRLQDSKDTPLVIRALSEKAKGEAEPLMEGGHGFAAIHEASDADRANDLVSGLYYVGMGEAEAEIATFDEGLGLRRNGLRIPLRSVSPELQRLQEQVTASFHPPLSLKHHADFIQLNATLKLAGELDANRSYAGALYQYLDAVQQFRLLDANAPDATRQSNLKLIIEKTRRELAHSQQDSSIAQLFLERAEARLAKSPTADDWKVVAIIVDQVLPAYSATLKSPPPPVQATTTGITVTLVRWPYT
jgi:hypothetical protein